jgi:hypothetical protein
VDFLDLERTQNAAVLAVGSLQKASENTVNQNGQLL